MDFLLRARPDALVVGNRWLSQIPGIRPWLIEVNPFSPDASDPGNVAGTRRILSHLRAGGCILTFPAGEVSSLRLRSRRVADPVWSPQVVRLARKVGASLLPLRVEGRNSGLFQSLGLVHPQLDSGEIGSRGGATPPLECASRPTQVFADRPRSPPRQDRALRSSSAWKRATNRCRNG